MLTAVERAHYALIIQITDLEIFVENSFYILLRK